MDLSHANQLAIQKRHSFAKGTFATGACPSQSLLPAGCATDAERNAAREAFYAFAQGDPGGFSVQFAVLLQAHARVLKCAPELLRKALATELTPVTNLITSNRSALSTSANAIAKDAADIRDQVVH